MSVQEIARASALEKRVHALDADEIVSWIIRLEDCATALEDALNEATRIMKEDRSALSESAPTDPETIEGVEVYDGAIEAAEAAVLKWRMTP